MSDKRLVYSNDPKDQEKVFSKNKKPIVSSENIIPQNICLKLRLETKSRGGKSVSLIYDLSVQNQKYWEDLTKKLKNHCACGGSYKKDSNTIEIQGDQRLKLKIFLEKLGFKVKP